ncbi:MAG: VOC family protein [Desulfobacterales bacterium]|nr:VOC family protein [Desulfobacterales bacterium]
MNALLSRPDSGQVEKLITFLYYKDLAAAMRFYEDVLGFSVAIDQGWCKIYGISSDGYVGLVDEARGSHKANPIKPVQICLRVPDVDAWHAYLKECNVEGLTSPRSVDELKIRVFVFYDPEGYQIEIQSVLN